MNDNNLMSQDEINALLGGMDNESSEESESSELKSEGLELTDMEKDALGEVGNISMGTAATTLFTLLGQKVNITTPKVEITTLSKLSEKYPVPFVAVDVKYKLGLKGSNILILRARDVKIIADLMMGGDGQGIGEEVEITEIDLSAISEAMNQMVGSGATSLAEMFGQSVDIEPPNAFQINLEDDTVDKYFDTSKEEIVKVSFKMEVGDLIDSEMMQLLPIEFAKAIVAKLLNPDGDEEIDQTSQSETIPQAEPTPQAEAKVAPPPRPEVREEVQPRMQEKTVEKTDNSSYNDRAESRSRQEPVTVKTMDFQDFGEPEVGDYHGSIDLINEVPIEISVELGRTMKKIEEILDYGPGTVIELEKLLGEPLNIYANSKMIAKGEVVVIEDNFGVRITEIVHPSKRINR